MRALSTRNDGAGSAEPEFAKFQEADAGEVDVGTTRVVIFGASEGVLDAKLCLAWKTRQKPRMGRATLSNIGRSDAHTQLALLGSK